MLWKITLWKFMLGEASLYQKKHAGILYHVYSQQLVMAITHAKTGCDKFAC